MSAEISQTCGSWSRFAAALLLSHLEENVALVDDPSSGENTIALHISSEDAFPVISADYRLVGLPPSPSDSPAS